MRHDSSVRFTVVAAAMLAILGTVIAAQTTTAPRPQGRGAPPATAPAPRSGPDAREPIARRVCGQCHPFEFVTAVRRTRPQWEVTVENMVGRGARATNAELSSIVDYLSENHVLTASTVRGGSGPDDRPIVDPKAASDAQPIYAAKCLDCHGPDGRGTPRGSNLVRSLVVLRDRYGDKLNPFLHGLHPAVPIPGRGGPPTRGAFDGLSSRDTLLLAHFLRERVNDTLRGAPMFKPGNVLTGDPRAGAEYFQGEGGCTQCHSPTGDLAGIGKRLEPVNLQQRFLFPQGGGRGRGATPSTKPVQVTVTTEAGETVSGVLDRMDDFTVSLRDEAGNYRSVRRTPGTRVVKADPFAAHVALLPRITDKNIHDVVAYLETLK